jgi:hypothetical protein
MLKRKEKEARRRREGGGIRNEIPSHLRNTKVLQTRQSL